MFVQVRWGSHGLGGEYCRRRFLRHQVRIPEVQHSGAKDPVDFGELRRLERFRRLTVIAGQNVACSVNGKFFYEPVFMSVQSGRGLMHWQVDRNARDAQKRLNVHGLNAT